MSERARGISIDNDIIGEPDIECLDDQIRVWVKTRKVFGGLFILIPSASLLHNKFLKGAMTQ